MSATETKALVERLRELDEKATPDAWYVSGSGDRLMSFDEKVDRGNEIGWLFNSVQSNGSVSYGAEKDNAKLICELRNALPQILAALEPLPRRDALREALQGLLNAEADFEDAQQSGNPGQRYASYARLKEARETARAALTEEPGRS